MRGKKAATTVEEYIAAAPKEVQKKLSEIRTIIKKAAPKTTEEISYGMPAYRQHSVLVYFGLFKTHIGFFPTGSGVAAFTDQLKGYKTSKGTIQFPLDKPLPKKLITDIVKFRIQDDALRQAVKEGKEKKKS
ncbi:MAG: DUF1801 domain-containing protein [Cyclobacteriaceae bacterium]